MQNMISTIEIALFIMLPLILFYKQCEVKIKYYFITIPVLYIIWYLSYMLLHELSHWLGAWVFNKEVYEYMLIPHVWKGNFGSGYIKYDFKGDYKDFIIVLLPYLRDIIFLLVGYWILKRPLIKSLFWKAFFLLMLLLSPLYDVSNNYIAYLLGSLNDFNALKISSNGFISNSIGIILMVSAIFLTYKTIRRGNPIEYSN